MSYSTEADKKFESAHASVEELIEALGEVVISRCEGYDECSQITKDMLAEALKLALTIRELIP